MLVTLFYSILYTWTFISQLYLDREIVIWAIISQDPPPPRIPLCKLVFTSSHLGMSHGTSEQCAKGQKKSWMPRLVGPCGCHPSYLGVAVDIKLSGRDNAARITPRGRDGGEMGGVVGGGLSRTACNLHTRIFFFLPRVQKLREEAYWGEGRDGVWRDQQKHDNICQLN